MTENDSNFRRFGTYHTSCGRVLKNSRTAALEDPAMDHAPAGIEPVRHVIEGAQAFNRAKGLADPHAGIDYHAVRTSRPLLQDLQRHHDALPLNDPAAHKHFNAMRDEVGQQYHHMTTKMGLKVQVQDHDPYKNVHELRHDVENNHRIQVMGTHVTGHHPFFTDDENDKFRAVHDVFGHLGTGRDFDRHGEEAAFQAHARMFSHHALPAMTTETRGQNGSLIVNGHFGPQRIAILPKHLWHPGLASMGMHVEAAIHPLLKQDWYHAGAHSLNRALSTGSDHNWLHVGTQQAALDRVHPKAWDYDDPDLDFVRHSRIHRVKVSPGASVCPKMHTDDEINEGDISPHHCGGDYDVHAYKNTYEDPGSTSLIVNPRKVQSVEDQGRHPSWSEDPEHSGDAIRQRRVNASLVDEYRWDRDAQDQRAERSTGGYGRETDSYYGRDGEGDARERRINFKDYLKQRKAPEERDYENQSWSEGNRLGANHLAQGDRPHHVHEFNHAADNAYSPEHFVAGYQKAWEHSVPERVAILVGSADDTAPIGMRVVAHVSGNSVNILHCPFCGSGAVIGRSDGTVECGYCTSVFTVQVQPAFNGFPQSVDGQQYPWPGQPGPGDTLDPSTPPGTNLAPGMAPAGDPMADPAGPMAGGAPESSDPADGDGGDEEEDDDDKPAFLKGKSDDKKSDSKDKKKGDNPFAKKKSYLTATGAKLSEEDYLEHIFIQTASDRARAIATVKAKRGQ